MAGGCSQGGSPRGRQLFQQPSGVGRMMRREGRGAKPLPHSAARSGHGKNGTGGRAGARKFDRMLKFLGFLFATGFIIFCGIAVGAGYIIWETQKDLPDYKQLALYEPPVMTRVHAADGSLIAEYAKQRRLFIPVDAVPPRVVEAFLSAEDKNF